MMGILSLLVISYIAIGDQLHSYWGYDVIVIKDDGELVGQLVCTETDSCREMTYHLDNGRGHTLVLAAADKEK